jgi:hypothetical protein
MNNKVLDANKNKEWLQWVLTNSSRYSAYHNHKETMAWVITGFYITGIITFGAYIASCKVWPNALLTLTVCIAAACILLFTTMQFKMRWIAADMQQVLLNLGSKLANNEFTPKSKLEFLDSGIFEGWPKFIAEDVSALVSKRNVKAAIKLALSNPLKLDNWWKTEISSYILIVLATFVSVTLIWRAISIGFLIVQIIDWLTCIGIVALCIWFNVKKTN